MKVLVIDVGGTNIKLSVSGSDEVRKIPSGRLLTPQQLVDSIRPIIADWDYDAITLGLPTPIRDGKPRVEPINLGGGWLDYEFTPHFDKPIKLINDAAMQALGSYAGGTMLFIGLGTGMGTALVTERGVLPTELAHLPYRKKRTFEQYVGTAALDEFGKKKWRMIVADVICRLYNALGVDYIVVGGGNAKLLEDPPGYVRIGSNRNAFIGGVRLWEEFTAAH